LALLGMMDNPLGEPIAPKRIDVTLSIREGNIDAAIIDARLDGKTYQPGDAVTGHVLIERYREDRMKLPFKLMLPDDLPDGEYPLSVGDAFMAAALRRSDQPHLFDPHTPQQLFEAIQRLAQPKANRLYLHLPLPAAGGLAIGRNELPDLPASKAAMLAGLELPDTQPTRRALTDSAESDYILSGRRSLNVIVKKHVNEMPVRELKGPF
jgi:hypothetical protein